MKGKNIIIIFLVCILIILSILLKNSFNLLLKKIYFIRENKIIFKDDLTKNYIKTLEEEISNYKNINNITNCKSSNVIYRNPISWYDSITIDKGTDNNIKINDMVINETGFIGLISKVYKNTSEVKLLTNINKNSSITVGISNDKNTIYGILSSYNKLKNRFIVSEITSDIDDSYKNVMTTSFTNKLNDGIVIGKIEEIKKDENGLSNYIVVIPNIDFNNIKTVCII